MRLGEVAQSCPTLCDPTDCSLPGSSIHGIFQARILEWVAISFSRGSPRPRDRTQVSHFTVWATREVTLSLLLYETHKLGDLGHVVKSLWASVSSSVRVIWLEEVTWRADKWWPQRKPKTGLRVYRDLQPSVKDLLACDLSFNNKEKNPFRVHSSLWETSQVELDKVLQA